MKSHGAIGKPISLEWLEINQTNRCVELQRQVFRNFKIELWLKLIDGFGTFFLNTQPHQHFVQTD